MSSSRTSASNTASTRLYRERHLNRAGILLEALPRVQWPQEVHELADHLTCNNFSGTLSSLDAARLCEDEAHLFTTSFNFLPSGALPPDGCVRALHLALKLRGAARAYADKVEKEWMRLAHAMLEDLLGSDAMLYSEDVLWNAPVPVYMAEGFPLSTPKPDLAIGLRPVVSSFESFEKSPTAEVLSGEFLDTLRLRFGVHPWPTSGLASELAFPWLVLEAKSDTGVLRYAENQAAGCAAKALAILRELEECHESCAKLPLRDTRLPVLVLCTQGSIWKFFIAFRQSTGRGVLTDMTVQLVRIWQGDIQEAWHLFQAQVVIQRAKLWALMVLRPTIEGLLADIRRTM